MNFSRVVVFFFVSSPADSFEPHHFQKNTICPKHTVLIFCFSKEKFPSVQQEGGLQEDNGHTPRTHAPFGLPCDFGIALHCD